MEVRRPMRLASDPAQVPPLFFLRNTGSHYLNTLTSLIATFDQQLGLPLLLGEGMHAVAQKPINILILVGISRPRLSRLHEANQGRSTPKQSCLGFLDWDPIRPS